MGWKRDGLLSANGVLNRTLSSQRLYSTIDFTPPHYLQKRIDNIPSVLHIVYKSYDMEMRRCLGYFGWTLAFAKWDR
jgi:hypothetical protein